MHQLKRNNRNVSKKQIFNTICNMVAYSTIKSHSSTSYGFIIHGMSSVFKKTYPFTNEYTHPGQRTGYSLII